MTDLKQSRVLITGAARGLGRRLALGVAARGGTPILWDVDGSGLDAVREELLASGSQAQSLECDVSDRAAVYQTAREVLSQGPVDVLFNNAGIVNGQSLLDIEDERIEKSFAVNSLGLFWVTKAFLPQMIERQKGHVVTIASAGGLVGVPRLTDYCATKWAAVGFDESLRLELASRAPALRTTVVCPFYINTGMFEGVKSRFPWLLPILDETRVAEKILRAVERDRTQLWTPLAVHSIPLLRLLPTSWFDAISAFLGISASMDDFQGRLPNKNKP